MKLQVVTVLGWAPSPRSILMSANQNLWKIRGLCPCPTVEVLPRDNLMCSSLISHQPKKWIFNSSERIRPWAMWVPWWPSPSLVYAGLCEGSIQDCSLHCWYQSLYRLWLLRAGQDGLLSRFHAPPWIIPNIRTNKLVREVSLIDEIWYFVVFHLAVCNKMGWISWSKLSRMEPGLLSQNIFLKEFSMILLSPPFTCSHIPTLHLSSFPPLTCSHIPLSIQHLAVYATFDVPRRDWRDPYCL